MNSTETILSQDELLKLHFKSFTLKFINFNNEVVRFKEIRQKCDMYIKIFKSGLDTFDDTEFILKINKYNELKDIEKTITNKLNEYEQEMIGLFKLLREVKVNIKHARYLTLVQANK